MRDAPINLRALPEQRDLIDRAARLLGKTRSDFMLEVACDAAQDALQDQIYFTVDEETFLEFNRILDAPAERNPGLERLMAVVPPWAKSGADE